MSKENFQIHLFHTSIVAPPLPQFHRIQTTKQPRITATSSDSPMFSSPSFASATATTPRKTLPGLVPQLLDPPASPWAVVPRPQKRQQVERSRGLFGKKKLHKTPPRSESRNTSAGTERYGSTMVSPATEHSTEPQIGNALVLFPTTSVSLTFRAFIL